MHACPHPVVLGAIQTQNMLPFLVFLLPGIERKDLVQCAELVDLHFFGILDGLL